MNFENLIRIGFKYLNRNRINYLGNHSRIQPGRINLHWWKVPGSVQNIGDALSPVIVEYMRKRLGCTEYKGSVTKHLLAIGSVIDMSYQDSIVWGSGLLYGNRKFWWRKLRKLDIRAVRGPETRRTLIENGYSCPEVYGDPAVLMPMVYMPESIEKEYDYRVIQHHLFNQMQDYSLSPMTDDWRSFVDEIVKCRLVISSSLHGIILAEAYGVPAVMLKTSLDTFKFRDYYYSTGRFDFPMASSVEEALHMEHAPLPDMGKMQRNIMDAFPSDLWKSSYP